MTLTDFVGLFDEFRAPSWAPWLQVLGRITPATREFIAIVGRGAGKSRIVALLATFTAQRSDFVRVPGERIYVGIFAPDRKQATVTFNYVVGLLKSHPALAALIEREGGDFIDLTSGVTVEVLTATKAAPRGRAYALVIIEEAAFLRDDMSANPDKELLIAVRPALARVKGSLLCIVSSPYARRGILWDAWRRHHAQPAADIVFVQAPTLDLNPAFDRKAIEQAYEEDPASAAAEYGAQFRTDVEAFVAREVLDHNLMPGRFELPVLDKIRYFAFVDPSGGSRDSFTLAIAHRAGDQVVLDVLRERTPPFSPEDVIREYATLVKGYRITTVVGDRYAGEFPRELFRKCGVSYEPGAKPKSDLYRDLLGRLNSGGVELLDNPKLITQLASLERRTARGGKDSIDHAPGGHDDLANAVAGVATLVSGHGRHEVLWGGKKTDDTFELVEVSPGHFKGFVKKGYRGRPAIELAEEISTARFDEEN